MPSDKAYHGSDALGSTAGACFLEDRLLYKARYIDREPWAKFDPTEATELGSAGHLVLLEPEKRANIVEYDEKNPKTGKPYGWDTKKAEAWRAARETEGKIVVPEHRLRDLDDCTQMLFEDAEVAGVLNFPGKNEQEHAWQQPTLCGDDITCKAKFDRLLDAGIILDLKFTELPINEWIRKRLPKYEFQIGHYSIGAKQLTGCVPHFQFLIAKVKRPFEFLLRTVDAGDQELCMLSAQHTYNQIAECRRSGDWRNIHPEGDLRLPSWRRKQLEEAL